MRTSTKKNEKGITMVEMLIALVVISSVFVGIANLTSQISKSERSSTGMEVTYNVMQNLYTSISKQSKESRKISVSDNSTSTTLNIEVYGEALRTYQYVYSKSNNTLSVNGDFLINAKPNGSKPVFEFDAKTNTLEINLILYHYEEEVTYKQVIEVPPFKKG